MPLLAVLLLIQLFWTLIICFSQCSWFWSESSVPICIICQEYLNANPGAVEALLCEHTFHSHCIRAWWRIKPSAWRLHAICKQLTFEKDKDHEPNLLTNNNSIYRGQGLLAGFGWKLSSNKWQGLGSNCYHQAFVIIPW
jgi:hypothetical protein